MILFHTPANDAQFQNQGLRALTHHFVTCGSVLHLHAIFVLSQGTAFFYSPYQMMYQIKVCDLLFPMIYYTPPFMSHSNHTEQKT